MENDPLVLAYDFTSQVSYGSWLGRNVTSKEILKTSFTNKADTGRVFFGMYWDAVFSRYLSDLSLF